MTSTDLARQGNHAIEQRQPRRELSLEVVTEMTGYSLPEVALIRHNMAAGMRCQPDEVPFIDVAMFCKATRSLGLDPLVRQAYWISRQGKGGLQIGIDGFRAIADRAGNYAGSEAPVFRSSIEWEHRGHKLIVPEYCQVTTWKIVQGHKAAFTGEARWVEYVPRLNGAGAESDMWAKMPRNQLAKCAEAQSLRKGWALQMGALAFHAEEPPGDDLPEVAAPQRQHVIEEQPQRPRPTAADYDRIAGSEESGTFFDGPPSGDARKGKPKDDVVRPVEERSAERSETLSAETDDDSGEDRGGPGRTAEQGDSVEASAADDGPEYDTLVAEALKKNVLLLEDARSLDVKGLGALTAKQNWPLHKINDANLEIQARIHSHRGDVGQQVSPGQAAF